MREYSLYIAPICLFKSFSQLFLFRFVTQHLKVASKSAFTKVDCMYSLHKYWIIIVTWVSSRINHWKLYPHYSMSTFIISRRFRMVFTIFMVLINFRCYKLGILRRIEKRRTNFHSLNIYRHSKSNLCNY